MNDRDNDVLGLIDAARLKGADRCDVYMMAGRATSASCRNGLAEGLEHSETLHVSLRVFIGNRAASISSTSLDPSRFDALASKAVTMARVVPEDFSSGWVSSDEKGATPSALLDIEDQHPPPNLQELLERARATENAALAHAGITNSNGASTSASHTTVTLADSDGFFGTYAHTRQSLGVSVLAGAGATMQRDYAQHSTRHTSDLKTPEALGREAAQRSLARLNPTKPRTGSFPVVFEKRVSATLLGHLAGAINGAAVARGTSFLADKLNARILPPNLYVCDDPTQVRGLRSRPFDAEGFKSQRHTLVNEGILVDWLLDSRSARQLNLPNNGRASRAIGSPPSPSTTNFALFGGDESFESLLSDIHEGVFIHELLGASINSLNGDYSRGASGFMIRNGMIAEPIAEFTIAGNLVDMFLNLRAANDLDFSYGVDAPTLRSDCMKVAGG